MRWLASVLATRDIAPHPNFQSQEIVDSPALLALVVDVRGRTPIRESLLKQRMKDSAQAERTVEDRLVEAAEEALNESTSRAGLDRLADLLSSGTVDDDGCLTATTLFASVFCAEHDELDLALQLLGTAQAKLLGTASDVDLGDKRLLLAALLQQKALRLTEAGQDGTTEMAEAEDLLLQARNLGKFTRFDTSAGVSWDSDRTCDDIIEGLLQANRSLRAWIGGPFTDDWQSVVRARPARLLQSPSARQAAGYSKYMESEFRDATGSRERIFGGDQDNGDADLYAALLVSEFFGHPRSQSLRSDLAVHRFLNSRRLSSEFLHRDGMRLARQARDKKRLTALLRDIRAGGALTSLRGETLHVLQSRVSRDRVGEADAQVLRSGAEVLQRHEARSALEGLARALRVPFKLQIAGGAIETVRLQAIWEAVTALEPVAGESDFVADLLLSEATIAQPDELYDRALARVASHLDWAAVETATETRWRSWLLPGGTVTLPMLRRVVLDMLTPEVAAQDYQNTLHHSADSLASALNQVLRQALPENVYDLRSAVPSLKKWLQSIREEAAGGRFSGRAVDEADLAVGVAQRIHDEELWLSIADFLSDLRVSADDKNAAFARISTNPDAVPDSARKLMQPHVPAVLESNMTSLFGRDVRPYPLALQCFASLRLLSDEDMLVAYARLSSATEAAVRAEAGRLLAVLALSSSAPTWAPAMSLQLSRDTEASVRAEAGRSLAMLLGREVAGPKELLRARVAELLRSDGLLVPMLTIRGLREAHEEALQQVVEVVRQLAVQHPAHTVRDAATRLLGE